MFVPQPISSKVFYLFLRLSWKKLQDLKIVWTTLRVKVITLSVNAQNIFKQNLSKIYKAIFRGQGTAILPYVAQPKE